MFIFLSAFSASPGPIKCSYIPNIANKTVAAKEKIFTISKKKLIMVFILGYTLKYYQGFGFNAENASLTFSKYSVVSSTDSPSEKRSRDSMATHSDEDAQ